MISEVADEADLDEEQESHFDKVRRTLGTVEPLTEDHESENLIKTARQQITVEIITISEKKEERDAE
ncbi:hypothetical protein NKG95_31845 [Mesorhizobium sp. M1423]|uniref:hypothetical protein n=1 Tax=Mesorhizobium sp. M1423 TaxID=2957101 RepID=UPI00333B6113